MRFTKFTTSELIETAISDAMWEAMRSVEKQLEACKDNPEGRLAIIRENYLPVIAGAAEALAALTHQGY